MDDVRLAIGSMVEESPCGTGISGGLCLSGHRLAVYDGHHVRHPAGGRLGGEAVVEVAVPGLRGGG